MGGIVEKSYCRRSKKFMTIHLELNYEGSLKKISKKIHFKKAWEFLKSCIREEHSYFMSEQWKGHLCFRSEQWEEHSYSNSKQLRGNSYFRSEQWEELKNSIKCSAIRTIVNIVKGEQISVSQISASTKCVKWK